MPDASSQSAKYAGPSFQRQPSASRSSRALRLMQNRKRSSMTSKKVVGLNRST